MTDAVSIDPEAIYDDGSLRLLLGFTAATLAKARKTEGLRFTRKGGRTLYFGRWVLDWLTDGTYAAERAEVSGASLP